MKRIAFLGLLLVFTIFLTPTVYADTEDELEREYSELIGGLPGSLSEGLPDELGAEGALSDAEMLTDWRFLLSAVSDILGAGIRKAIPILAVLCGTVCVAALLSAFRGSLSPGIAQVLSTCTGCATVAAAVALQYEFFAGAASYLSDLSMLVSTMLPLTVSLYAAGGNVAAATVSGGAFGIFLNLCENLLAKTVMPFSGICLAFAVTGGISSHIDLRGIVGVIKKTYMTVLTFVMSLFSFILAAQNAIAAGSDSLSLRAARFVAGSVIPVLGGSVGESMRTLATGVGMLRKSIGVIGIVLIFLLFLPTLISLLLMRTVNGIASGFAALLGCSREAALLSEISSVYGYICGVLCVCSLMFVFTLTLLVGAATVGG